MKPIALIGSDGQLGSDIMRAWADSSLAASGQELIGLTHRDIEILDPVGSRSVLASIEPSLVINTAAYIRVDECEAETQTALQVNALGAKYLAEACRDLGSALLHMSTDYVFDGRADAPYVESHTTLPNSAYGVSKLAGEQFVRYMLPDNYVIVRSSGLYGIMGASGKGGNFVEAILRRARVGQELRVVDDQVTCPTLTADLAVTLLKLIERQGRGVFHVTNAGSCTWFEFASAILQICALETECSPISTAEYGLPANRPAYSVLANQHLTELGISQPRHWREALTDYLRIKGHIAI